MARVLAPADLGLRRRPRTRRRGARRPRYRRRLNRDHLRHAPRRRRPDETVSNHAHRRRSRRRRLNRDLRPSSPTRRRLVRNSNWRRKFRRHLPHRKRHPRHRHRRPLRRRRRQLGPSHRLPPRIDQRFRFRDYGRNLRLRRANPHPRHLHRDAPPDAKSRRHYLDDPRASLCHRRLLLDPRPSRREHHGDDRTRPRDRNHSPAPLLWWHEHGLYRLRNWLKFANFVLY